MKVAKEATGGGWVESRERVCTRMRERVNLESVSFSFLFLFLFRQRFFDPEKD